MKYYFFN